MKTKENQEACFTTRFNRTNILNFACWLDYRTLYFFRSVTTKEGRVNYEIHCFFKPACFCIRAAFFLWLFHRDTGLVDDPFYLQKTDGLLSVSYC